jgi:hypothetical protein
MENGKYTKRKKRKSIGAITISTTINQELWNKANEHSISWAEALRVGMTSILSRIEGEDEFNNPFQQQEKILNLINKLEELTQENYRLMEENKKLKPRGKIVTSKELI